MKPTRRNEFLESLVEAIRARINETATDIRVRRDSYWSGTMQHDSETAAMEVSLDEMQRVLFILTGDADDLEYGSRGDVVILPGTIDDDRPWRGDGYDYMAWGTEYDLPSMTREIESRVEKDQYDKESTRIIDEQMDEWIRGGMDRPGHRANPVHYSGVTRRGIDTSRMLNLSYSMFTSDMFSVSDFFTAAHWSPTHAAKQAVRELLDALVLEGRMRRVKSNNRVRYQIVDVGREDTPGALLASLRPDVREFLSDAIDKGWRPERLGTKFVRFRHPWKGDVNFVVQKRPHADTWRERLSRRMDLVEAPYKRETHESHALTSAGGDAGADRGTS